MSTALLTFGIGPVHSFIEQARRVADVWAGSDLLSHLIKKAIEVVTAESDCGMIFPHLEKSDPIPKGLPNRFVCRVPAARAEEVAQAMRGAVESEWNRLVEAAVAVLRIHRLDPPETTGSDRLLQFAWSWVPEREGLAGYAEAATDGARSFAASRLFRPFLPSDEKGEKCAVCGERTALPNGDRAEVKKRWAKAEANARPEHRRFLREDQGRLCLVCATKRFYPLEQGRDQNFEAFDKFQPAEDKPYFALVKMDGDRMGSTLSLGPEAIDGGDLERFHRSVSEALTRFAEGLRTAGSAALNLEVGELAEYSVEGRPPQLIYAGGDDVLFVCDARDALPLTRRLQARYLAAFEEARKLLLAPEDRERFTISAAILFAHPRQPAGLLLHDLEVLLEEGAKAHPGKNAVALRLAKRGGVPVQVVLPWDRKVEDDGASWPETLDRLTGLLRGGGLSSRQTFTLRLEERTLRGVFKGDRERWKPWLADRLSRNEGTAGSADDLAELVTPFFVHDRTAALRIARFLGREV